MIKFTKTLVRPSKSVAWYIPSAETLAHIEETYTSKRKLRVMPPTLSKDGLTQVNVSSYPSQTEVDDMNADPVIIANVAAMEAYYAENGITMSRSREDYP